MSIILFIRDIVSSCEFVLISRLEAISSPHCNARNFASLCKMMFKSVRLVSRVKRGEWDGNRTTMY